MLRVSFAVLLASTAVSLPGQAQQAPAPAPATPRSNANGRVTVSGYLKDAANGEALIGATVGVQSLGIGTSTNEYGFYSLTLPQGTYTLTYSYIGYAVQQVPLTLTGNVTQSVRLQSQGVQTGEVIVTG